MPFYVLSLQEYVVLPSAECKTVLVCPGYLLPAMMAKAGAKIASKRIIEAAKKSDVTAKTIRKMFLLVGFLSTKYKPIRKNKIPMPNSM